MFFFLMIRRPPRSTLTDTLFPYTTPFRSCGTPHSNRQREAMARCLCDICGKSLKASTKVSLSHARPYPHGAEGWAVLQVEPMMHRKCAAVAIQHCPSLKRDVENGKLMIRQVLRYSVQIGRAQV